MIVRKEQSLPGLSAATLGALLDDLPTVAERTVAAIADEITEYNLGEIGPETASLIRDTVEITLANFLHALAEPGEERTPLAPALEAAYELGRREARAGRSMEAVLAAYRIGGRVAWQEQAGVVVEHRASAATMAWYAERVFEFVDELSSAGVAGHRDELARSGRRRDLLLQELALGLVSGVGVEEASARAERAQWRVPRTITVVALRSAHLPAAIQLLDPRTLRLPADLADPALGGGHGVLLVPDAEGERAALLGAVGGRGAIVGPARTWTEAHLSYRRVVRAAQLLPVADDGCVDTDEHLVELLLGADPTAHDDLRARVLAPLAGLRPAAAQRLAATLRSWLLHQGRREEVAAELSVHPQTVRYRMGQLHELFGPRLARPECVLELVVALAAGGAPGQPVL